MTEDNRLLLCNRKSRNLLAYSEHDDHLQDCLLFGEPLDIAIIPGGKKTAVTLDSVPAIQFIDLCPIKPGRTLSLQNKCYGITVIKNYLCLGGRSVIYILDNAGQAVRTIEIDQVGFIWYLHPGSPEPLNRNESGRFGALKSDSTHHFYRNASTKSGSLRFSQFSGC